MADTRQTSIRITETALAALHRICAYRSTKLEPTIRELLRSFIDCQQGLAVDQRLAHISTVLSYPYSTKFADDPPPTQRLPIRITTEMQAAAEQYAYRIPGHANRQSHKDYASSPLGAAVTAAIAMEEHFQEPGLAELPVLIEHRQGDGLWRLVVAASLTGEEKRALTEERKEIADMILEGEIMWHSPSRSALAVQIARNLFVGPIAQKNLELVGKQQREFLDWLDELRDPRTIYGGHEISDDAPARTGSHEGRAATALWRAKRVLERETIAQWLVSESQTPTLSVETPKWTLTSPPEWRAVPFLGTSSPPPRLHQHWKQGQVLRIDSGRYSAFWPVNVSGDPIPGLGHIIRGAGHTDPVRLAEALLITIDDPSKGETVYISPPRVDINDAYAVGLVEQVERDNQVQEARETTNNRMHECLSRLKQRSDQWSQEALIRLKASTNSQKKFLTLSKEYGLQFRIKRPIWSWEIRSVQAALEVLPPLTGPQLELFGREWSYQIARALEREMYASWNRAMWHYREREIDQTNPNALRL